MPPLNSTAITFVSWNADSETLTLTFSTGRSYDYPQVPEQVYLDLMAAPSAGAYFNANIKGRYG